MGLLFALDPLMAGGAVDRVAADPVAQRINDLVDVSLRGLALPQFEQRHLFRRPFCG